MAEAASHCVDLEMPLAGGMKIPAKMAIASSNWALLVQCENLIAKKMGHEEPYGMLAWREMVHEEPCGSQVWTQMGSELLA